jgi:hypothetical protein
VENNQLENNYATIKWLLFCRENHKLLQIAPKNLDSEKVKIFLYKTKIRPLKILKMEGPN